MPNEKEVPQSAPTLTLAQVRDAFTRLRDAVDLERAPSDELKGIFGYMQANANLGVLLCNTLESWIIRASQDIGSKLREIEQQLQPSQAPASENGAPPDAVAQAAAELANLPANMRGPVTQVAPGAPGAPAAPASADPAAIAAALNKSADVPHAPVLSSVKTS